MMILQWKNDGSSVENDDLCDSDMMKVSSTDMGTENCNINAQNILGFSIGNAARMENCP